MAVKRYIATDLPKQAWYMKLQPKFKALWVHLLLECDIAGSFEVTPELFSVFVGDTISETDIFTAFGNRVVRWKDKGLIPAFVRCQYYSNAKKRLTPECKQHAYVIARLRDLGLTEAKLDELCDRSPQMQMDFGIADAPEECDEPKPKRKVFVKPTVEEIAEYCSTRNNSVDAQRFYDFYESKGWKVGNTPMKDWKAAVRTWEQRGSDASKKAPSQVRNVLQDESYHRKPRF